MSLVSSPILISILSLYFHVLASIADDRLEPGQSISVSQTIISSGGVFALGFFWPDSSATNHYVGIWYNNLPERTIVWVANREKPVKDSAGFLKLTDDGNIAVLDGKGFILWSSNVSIVPNNTAAVLLDSGNLVLRQGKDNDIWQSFDHPTDTFLPNMVLRSNFKTGIGQQITSWKDIHDPSPGNFSFGIDPITSLQVIIWQGSYPYWRSHVWNGKSLSGARETNTTSQYVLKVVANDEEISITFGPTQGFAMARYVLDPCGRLKMMFWREAWKNWTITWSRPSKPCDAYDRCGPSGFCDSGGPSPQCKCLHGFDPRNQEAWNVGNYSEGCVRRVELSCDKGDKFFKSERMKLPDRLTWLRNANQQQCESECLYNCQCTAYAYANMSGGGSSQRCLVWVDELMDLEQVASGGEELNVRLVASEIVTDTSIDGSSHKDNDLVVILLPTIAAGVFILGIFAYFMRRKMVKRGSFQEIIWFSEFCCLLYDSKINDLEVKYFYSKQGRGTSEAIIFGDLNERDGTKLPLLDFANVSAATNNFSAANKLGEGGFGSVYKGSWKDQEIAVKRLSKTSGQGYEEFKNEVELIARLQHTNLVRLLGWCVQEDEKLLIYEYLPNKSLDKLLFDPNHSAELDWGKRFHIIEGIAQGLLYLHRYSRLRIIHRDLKTSNVLLDGAMNPKISDFGLARIFGGNQTEVNTKRVVGTYGYMSPEYALNGLFSEKSDVFSFGVVLIEIVTGKRSTGFYPCKEALNLLGYAWQLWEDGRGLELMDSNLGSSIQAPEVMRCIQVGLLCVQESTADRPTMSHVVSMLGNVNASLPSPKQPAFAIGRLPEPVVRNLSSSASNGSLNEVTVSAPKGR